MKYSANGSTGPLWIVGHCYSKKNHRPIFRAGRRPIIGKSKQLRAYEAAACAQLREQWSRRESSRPLFGPVGVGLVVRYVGPEPDALGPAETVYDALQAAGIVDDDKQIVPWGEPAVARIHAGQRQDEGVLITLYLLEVTP